LTVHIAVLIDITDQPSKMKVGPRFGIIRLAATSVKDFPLITALTFDRLPYNSRIQSRAARCDLTARGSMGNKYIERRQTWQLD